MSYDVVVAICDLIWRDCVKTACDINSYRSLTPVSNRNMPGIRMIGKTSNRIVWNLTILTALLYTTTCWVILSASIRLGQHSAVCLSVWVPVLTLQEKWWWTARLRACFFRATRVAEHLSQQATFLSELQKPELPDMAAGNTELLMRSAMLTPGCAAPLAGPAPSGAGRCCWCCTSELCRMIKIKIEIEKTPAHMDVLYEAV